VGALGGSALLGFGAFLLLVSTFVLAHPGKGDPVEAVDMQIDWRLEAGCVLVAVVALLGCVAVMGFRPDAEGGATTRLSGAQRIVLPALFVAEVAPIPLAVVLFGPHTPYRLAVLALPAIGILVCTIVLVQQRRYPGAL
jgi:hypothetical protein